MTAVAICTDSSASFPDGFAEELGITVVPIGMTLDGDVFEEQEGAIDDFYARLSEGAQVTTSQPSPGDFLSPIPERRRRERKRCSPFISMPGFLARRPRPSSRHERGRFL